MNDKTIQLKKLQDKVHDIMCEICTSFKDESQSKVIIMNLTTTSKELNSMINSSITEIKDDE